MVPHLSMVKQNTNELEAAETAARPKVMRRPQQFSAGQPASEEPVFAPAPIIAEEAPNLAEPSRLPAPTTHLHATPWQDDVRFGAVMLGIVIVVNVALMLWLPHMRPISSSVHEALITSEAPAPTVQPESTLGVPVTMYTKSAQGTWTETPINRDGQPGQPVHILGAGHTDDAR